MRTMIVLLMIFSSSCKSPVIRDVEMCDISFSFNRCRCRMVDLNTLKSKSEPINYDLEYCEGFAGFRLEDIAEEIVPKVKAKVRICEDSARFPYQE